MKAVYPHSNAMNGQMGDEHIYSGSSNHIYVHLLVAQRKLLVLLNLNRYDNKKIAYSNNYAKKIENAETLKNAFNGRSFF